MQDIFSVKGKTAIVTGGSSGIGAMIAEGLVRAGALVTLIARDENKGQAKAKELSEFGHCEFMAGDLASVAGIEAIANQLKSKRSHLDILINNAGLLTMDSIDEVTEESWDGPININLKAVFFLTQKLLPLLRAAGKVEKPARVINIGSVSGVQVDNLDLFSYAAAKAGVHHMTKLMAQKLADDHITVNAIAPGVFPTDIGFEPPPEVRDAIINAIPLKRLGKPENIVGGIIFLASDAGAYNTGLVLTIDGGKAL